jgi:hypothetical protein
LGKAETSPEAETEVGRGCDSSQGRGRGLGSGEAEVAARQGLSELVGDRDSVLP